MEHLEQLTQSLKTTIDSTLDTLALEAMAKMIKKLRTYNIEGQSVITMFINNEPLEKRLNYKAYFKTEAKAELFYKKENRIIDLKEPFEEVFTFAHQFGHYNMVFNVKQMSEYSESRLLTSISMSFFRSGIAQNFSLDLIEQEIEKLNTIEEKNKLEQSIIDNQSNKKLKL